MQFRTYLVKEETSKYEILFCGREEVRKWDAQLMKVRLEESWE